MPEEISRIECYEISTPRYDEGFLLLARFFALIRLCVWLRGDLNLQAKSLMLLESIPIPNEDPSNQLRLLGFFNNWVAGIGFEPVTIRL